MKRFTQSLFFITGLVFFCYSQVVWNLESSDKLPPYALTSIMCFLIAIYLKEGNQ